MKNDTFHGVLIWNMRYNINNLKRNTRINYNEVESCAEDVQWTICNSYQNSNVANNKIQIANAAIT